MAADDLCTLAQVRTVLEIPAADTSRDTLISDRITAASRMITSYIEREFIATASATRRFEIPVGHRVIDLAPYDLRTASTITLHPESDATVLSANTDYTLRPLNPRFGVYTQIAFSYRLDTTGSQMARDFGMAFLDIAGAWGFASVPGEARDACIDCVVAWMRRDMSAISYDGTSVDAGMFGERPASAFTIPLSARQKLDVFRRSLSAV